MRSDPAAMQEIVRNYHRPARVQRSRRLRFPLSGLAAAAIAFLAAYEPNAALRYGPFIAVAAFLFSRPLRFRIGATEWALAAFLVWALLSLIWTNNPDASQMGLIVYLSLAAMFTGVRAATRWGQNESIAVTGYIAGCIYGLAQTSLQLVTGSGPVYLDAYGRITQVGALNVNYVAYTTIGAIVLLILAMKRGQIQRRRVKALAFAALVILVVGGISTQTRGVQVSMVLLGVWLLIAKFGRPVKTITTGCILIAAGASFGWIDGFLAEFDFGDRSVENLSGRLPLWESARATWADSFFAGGGLGADRSQNDGNMATHNMILGMGMTLGIVGLVLFLTFVVSSVNDRIQGLSADDRRFRIITIALAFTPIILTGAWEGTASGWVGLALLSTPIVAATRKPSRIPSQ